MEEKYDEALKYYLRVEERYNYPGPVVGFCVRYKSATGDSRFDSLVQERLKTLFPQGIEKVELKSFTAKPRQGVQFTDNSELLRQAGLKKADIVVALDGIRVYAMTQYQYVRALTKEPVMKLIVWDGTRYAEKEASPPNRRFGVQLTDFYLPGN